MPLEGHRIPIGGAIISRRAAIFCDKPCDHFAEDGVRVSHTDLLIGLLEGNGDEVQKSIDEGRVHVDNVIATFLGHGVHGLGSGAGVRVDGTGVIGHIIDIGGEGIVGRGISLTAGIVCIEGWVNGDI